MFARNLLFVGLILAGAAALLATIRATPTDAPRSLPAWPRESGQPPAGAADSEIAEIVAAVDAAFRAEWSAETVSPAPRADDLTIARRLALALLGTIPSLEEIRRFEALPAETRLARWTDELLADRRSADYLAERFARAYLGVEQGPFLVFRRRRFVSWLADQLAANRPYDQLAREILSTEGLWTDAPATNFVTVTLVDGVQRPDSARLAGRVARGFLGVRIDCAECHDHPFEPWKQRDFAGLAAFFDDCRQTFTGIRDVGGPEARDERSPADNDGTSPVSAAVPFQPEHLPDAGRQRERLAAWVTDPHNTMFARAITNRMWGLMCGQPLVLPVDQLPLDGGPRPLDLLAEDFAAHGYDLRRLVRAIAATEVYALSSQGSAGAPLAERHAECWAAFPVTRLRPEQTARSLYQARSLETVDQDTSLLLRFAKFVGQSEFVERNGDLGEDELSPNRSTIPQRLLLMNGKQVRETIDESNFVNASGRIAQLAPDDAKAVEIAYLTILTRRPTAAESVYFVAELSPLRDKERARRIEDLCWTLVNSMEFGWNH